MQILKWCGYGAFVGAAVCALAVIEFGPFPFLGGAFALIATGAFFLALDRIIQLLGAILAAFATSSGAEVVDTGIDKRPQPRSIAEISADLQRVKARI